MTVSRRSVLTGLGGLGGLGCCGILGLQTACSAGDEILCRLKGRSGFRGVSGIRMGAPEAIRLVRLICETVGVQPNIDVRAADFKGGSTAFAAIERGRRIVVYDAAKFSFGGGRTDWRSVGIIGHEVGHHLAAHTFAGYGTLHERELEADYFAGVAVSRLGGALKHAQEMSGALGIAESATHPARTKRVKMIESGWRQGEKLKTREGPACKTGWLGDTKFFDGQSCRMARTCKRGKERLRLACTDYDGQWIWAQ